MKKKLSPSDLSDFIAQRLGTEKADTDAFVRKFFEKIEEGLLSDKYVKIKGFGTFKLVAVGERESVNINTGERFQISGHTKVSFTPDNALKEMVNRPFAHFETVDLNDDTDVSEFEQIDKLSAAECAAECGSEDAEEDDAADDIAEGTDSSMTNEANAENQHISSTSQPMEAESPTTDTPTNEFSTPQATPKDQQEKDSHVLLPNETNKEGSTNQTVTGIIPISSGNDPVSSSPEKTQLPTNASIAAAASTADRQVPADEKADEAPLDTVEQEDSFTDSDASTPTNSEASEASEGEEHADPPQGHSAEATPTSNANAEEDEIEVSAPHPINTAGSTPQQLQIGNGNLEYTYQEVPSPRKRNLWKIATLTLCTLLVMVGCYFVGYFRMLCPNCFFDDEPAEPKAATLHDSSVPPQTPAKPLAQPAPQQPSEPSPQQPAETQQTADQPATQQAGNPAKTPAKEQTPQTQDAAKQEQASTQKTETVYHKVKKGENLTRIVRRHYGSEAYVARIIKINHLKDANNVKEGMIIELPPLQ